MWLLYALLSYACTALTSVADKVLLNKTVSHPFVYAFTIAMLGCLVIVAAPFGVSIITPLQLLLALASGALFVGALLVLFYAYKQFPVSVAATLVGGVQPIATLFLARLVLHELLSPQALLAVALLVVSIFFLAYQPRQRYNKQLLFLTTISGTFFASSFVVGKLLYTQVSFLDGIFWSRLGAGVTALILLTIPSFYNALKETKQTTPSAPLYIILVQAVGALGFILFNAAISAGSVTIVNALLGVQFAFIFLFSRIGVQRFPALYEQLTLRVWLARLTGLALVVGGLILLS